MVGGQKVSHHANFADTFKAGEILHVVKFHRLYIFRNKHSNRLYEVQVVLPLIHAWYLNWFYAPIRKQKKKRTPFRSTQLTWNQFLDFWWLNCVSLDFLS